MNSPKTPGRSTGGEASTQMGRVARWGIFAFAFGMFALVGGPFLLDGWREYQILEHGEDAVATVIQIKDTKDRANENPVVALTVEVSAEGREPYRATIVTPISVVELQNYTVGGQVRVRYDAEDPSKVALVGPVLAPAPAPAPEKDAP